MILGTIDDKSFTGEFAIENSKTIHAVKDRRERMDLLDENQEPLLFFNFYHQKTSSIQVHCLLKDATLLVFNKSNKKLITFFFLYPKRLDKYLNWNKNININKKEISKLYQCALLNKKNNVNSYNGESQQKIESFKLKREKILKNIWQKSKIVI